VLQHGMRLAEHIRKETTLQGRRRRPDVGAAHDDGGTGGSNRECKGKLFEQGDDGLRLVLEAATERTTRSPRCPRRSAKRSYLQHQQTPNCKDEKTKTSQSSETTEQRRYRSFSSRSTVRTASPRGPRGDTLASPGGVGVAAGRALQEVTRGRVRLDHLLASPEAGEGRKAQPAQHNGPGRQRTHPIASPALDSGGSCWGLKPFQPTP
jgi:hypothetical protein